MLEGSILGMLDYRKYKISDPDYYTKTVRQLLMFQSLRDTKQSIPEADLYEMTKGWFMPNYLVCLV